MTIIYSLYQFNISVLYKQIRSEKFACKKKNKNSTKFFIFFITGMYKRFRLKIFRKQIYTIFNQKYVIYSYIIVCKFKTYKKISRLYVDCAVIFFQINQ